MRVLDQKVPSRIFRPSGIAIVAKRIAIGNAKYPFRDFRYTIISGNVGPEPSFFIYIMYIEQFPEIFVYL